MTNEEFFSFLEMFAETNPRVLRFECIDDLPIVYVDLSLNDADPTEDMSVNITFEPDVEVIHLRLMFEIQVTDGTHELYWQILTTLQERGFLEGNPAQIGHGNCSIDAQEWTYGLTATFPFPFKHETLGKPEILLEIVHKTFELYLLGFGLYHSWYFEEMDKYFETVDDTDGDDDEERPPIN